MRVSRLGVGFALLGGLVTAPAFAATLPAHGPLRVLVISDEVNPNNLSDENLTQRGDISAALNAADSGLDLADDATEVFSQCVDDALDALRGAQPPNVVIYFAHRGAVGCDQSDQQTALFAALEAHLKRGGGIVVFHHGSYTAQGKELMMPLIGVSASSISWNTTEGQRVFNVAPGHFVTTNGLTYSGSAALTAMGAVPAGTFEYFDNIPDERYPATALLTQTGETRTILFASNSGGTRVIGYSLERPGWLGRVVFYQPAEYQPHALDDRAGPNFQILANAIVYSTHLEGGVSAGGAGGASGSTSVGGVGDGGASNGGVSNGGTNSSAGGGGTSSSTAGSATGGTGASSSSGGQSATGGSASSASGGVPATGGGSPATPSDSKDSSGCGCRLGAAQGPTLGGSAALLLATLGLLGRRRRQSATR